MRHFHRVIMLAVLLGPASALNGCTSFDPDKLDFLNLNAKQPLPGERKPVFPEGVPGVTQGIPPEYLQGNVQHQAGGSLDATQTPPSDGGAIPGVATEPVTQTATAEPAANAEQLESKPQGTATPRTNPKPKRRVVKRMPKNTPVQAAATNQNAQGQEPSPWPSQAKPQQTTQHTEPAQSPWPSPAQNTIAPWPPAPPPGSFSR